MLNTCKTALRIKTDAYDSEIQTYINTMLYDLERLKIKYNAEQPESEIKTLAVCYVKSQFGAGNVDYKQAMYEAYKNLLRALLMDKSKRNNS